MLVCHNSVKFHIMYYTYMYIIMYICIHLYSGQCMATSIPFKLHSYEKTFRDNLVVN